MDAKKVNSDHVERVDSESYKVQDFVQDEVAVMGTVKLTSGQVVYIPTPTADPQGIQLLPDSL
jgi:hypothetical protein